MGNKIRRTMALAGAATLSAGAFAFSFDTQILIERALNSPTLTVKYDGANATLVELRVNGESISTKSVSAASTKGEATFTLTVTDLKDGENEIEVRLFDKTGKVISTQKQSIFTDEANRGPVYISGTKQGATVQGPVEIKVGFGKELRNVFVSFFVDGEHKSISNVKPYNYVWDTQKESNGWHTVEAWVVDESTNTYKSKPVRVFVNNPGGRTNRHTLGSSAEPKLSSSGTKPTLTETSTNVKPANVGGEATAAPEVVKAVNTTVNATSAATPVKAAISPKVDGGSTAVKAANLEGALAMGSQNMTPTGTRMAKLKVSSAPDLAAVSARKAFAIDKGTRLEGVSTFAVTYEGSFVEFDVAPRVDNGVPMAPFRHLIEKAGGEVKWMSDAKVVSASADGKTIVLKIGNKDAFINDMKLDLELAPYIDRGRTIVPISFMKDALNVKISFDPATGHVLIQKIDAKK